MNLDRIPPRYKRSGVVDFSNERNLGHDAIDVDLLTKESELAPRGWVPSGFERPSNDFPDDFGRDSVSDMPIQFMLKHMPGLVDLFLEGQRPGVPYGHPAIIILSYMTGS